MNTVLSSYNGLTLAALVVTLALVTAFNLNGYTIRRRHIVYRGDTQTAHVVSRHYTLAKANEARTTYASYNETPGVFTVHSS